MRGQDANANCFLKLGCDRRCRHLHSRAGRERGPDQEEALELSDRIVLLNAGAIEQEGTPAQIYARPTTAFASSYLGSANLLHATMETTPEGPVAKLEDGQRLAVDQ